ncbi:MAG: YraN family protein [Firmicutes bacterium]|nr:YraN family protein [Bacillota bacterium]
MGNPKKAIGDAGEAFAAQHLEAHGFRIAARNFRTRLGEVDIIARGSQYLLFVEVKARRAGSMVSGEEAVDFHKQRRLRAAAEYYLVGRPCDLQPRFDVMCVELGPGGSCKLSNWIEDAF